MSEDAGTVAVVTMEMQRGVCGDLATIDALAAAVATNGVADAAGRLVSAARGAGVPVVHCTFSLPADRSGLDLSSPLLAPALDDPAYLLAGSAGCELLLELGSTEADLISDRSTGVSPFGQTDLHQRLTELGITDLVVCGVSLNVGIPGLVIEAVNHGYAVTVAQDAVVGLPEDYGQAVVRNTLRHIATIATVDEIISRWTTASET